ncbi:sensor histidine kinase [Parapedobacter sp. DT-150]|uniref:sensor histidine kinase n=1 Tax=Parapedobacter sp. DT-150 TaxID=3396162 RepID=UPI003F1A437F
MGWDDMALHGSQRYRFGWKYHIGVCLIALLGFSLYWFGVVRDAHPSHRNDAWVSSGINIAIFYLNFLWVWPLAVISGRLRWGWVLLILATNVLVMAAASLAVSTAFGNLQIDLEGLRPMDILSIFGGSIRNLFPYAIPNLFSLLTGLVAFLVEWIYLPFANRKDTERKIQQARQAWRRAQLDPHLLDTHLVVLSVITRESRHKAQLALDHTIKVIQFYIGDNDPAAPIQLEDEIACVQHLIEIQRIRYGDALNWRLETEGNVAGISVAPMMLMPLAENIMRYAEVDRLDAPAVIGIRAMDDNLVITTENRIRITKGRQGSGTGLSNLEERLGYAYPGRHRLTVREERGWFYTELIIYNVREPQPYDGR